MKRRFALCWSFSHLQHRLWSELLDRLEQTRDKLEALLKQENANWESELVEILDEIDGFVKANLKNGEDRAEELRDELKKEFDGLWKWLC